MYLPPAFAGTDLLTLCTGIRSWPLATIIEQVSGGLDANHLPMLLVETTPGAITLQGHAPLQNPIGDDTPEGKPVLVIFHGPSAYITPAWYPTKREHGRVVPTWNYEVIHIHGRMRIVRDAHWISAQLEGLTRQQESTWAEPWSLEDAPTDYIQGLVTRLKGIEIVIDRIIGKTKASQDQPAANHQGVPDGLKSMGSPAVHSVEQALYKRNS